MVACVTTELEGLSEAEAAKRLAEDGPNALPSAEHRTILRVVVDAIREPMMLLLFGAASIYLVFGDLREALTLLAFVVVVVSITVVQEGRTERTLDALRDLTSPRAQVLRDGQVRTVAGREVVRGDLIRVAEGDRVPADARLVLGTSLSVDESLLTGESVPVTKTPEDQPTLYSGTVVTKGRGSAIVTATGARTEIGRIGEAVRRTERERSPLQKDVDDVVRRVAVVGGAAAVVLVVVRGLTEHAWLPAVLSGITLAMALLPEEFPLVLTVFQALGARRLAIHHVLTRRVSAVETLGAVHVLCTDKTGTLTENRMAIARLRTATVDHIVTGQADLPEDVHPLVEFGILACPRDPFDPMEKAFIALGERTLASTEHLHPRWEKTREYPLTSALLAVTNVWQSDEAPQRLVVATKGAPEAVFDLCHLSDDAKAPWQARVDELAEQGLRVLAIARGTAAEPGAPPEAHDLDFELLGLVGLADPVRPDVPAAVATCGTAGVRVVMITGDHPATARAIARAAGIEGELLTGPELDALDDEALTKRLEKTAIIARSMPEQKLRIVRAFRSTGAVVGMTGDGVNDAPALKAADIGIAMGERGTDVAREAAALVLTHDDFSSIVAAVRGGRRVYDNLKNAFAYIVAVHVPIAGLALVPALLRWEPLLAPAQVMFLELIIDPACSIVFELEDESPDVMQRPPRPHGTKLFDLKRLASSALPGFAVFGGALELVRELRGDLSEGALRGAAFAALVFGNLAALLTSRSDTIPFWYTIRAKNRALAVLGLAATALTLLFVTVQPVGALFGFVALGPAELGRALAWAVVPVLLLDIRKARY